jgi:hypothetical protein
MAAFGCTDAFFHIVQQGIDVRLADEQEFVGIDVEADHRTTCMAAMRE